MSVESVLKERFNLQEGDELTFFKDSYQKQVEEDLEYGLSNPDTSSMDHLVTVKRVSGKMGIYTISGDVVVPEDNHKCYPSVYKFWLYDECYREVIHVRKDKLSGLLTSKGEQIIPCIYERVEVCDRYILVWEDVLCGVYSYSGKQILKTEFKSVIRIGVDNHVALICVNKCGLWGVYSEDGKEIIPCAHKKVKYDNSHYNNPIHLFEVEKQNGYISLYSFDGKEITEDEVDNLQWGDRRDKPPIFANGQWTSDFILAFKDGKPAVLYKNTGEKIVPEVEKYSKMYLEKEFIICIGHGDATMDAYDFNGNKIVEYKP